MRLANLASNANGPGAAAAARGPAIGELAPMTPKVSHGAATREPVYRGRTRVRGLWQRRLTDDTVVFEARLRLDGRDRKIRLEATTKTDAIREAESLRVDRDRGERRHRSLAPTLDELAGEWLEHLEARVGIRDERRSYSQRTVDLYRQRLRDHILERLGRVPVDELTADDVRQLVDRLTRQGLAPGTVTSCVNILSGLLRYALKRKVVAHNVVRDLDRDDRPGVRRQSEPRYLTADELERLLAQMSDTFRPVASVCAYAGLRVSEALGLRWRDLDLKAGTISVTGQLGVAGNRLATTKTRASAAKVPLLPALERQLSAHRVRQARMSLALVRADELVFTTARGKPQSRRNALRAIRVAGDKAKLNGDGLEPIGLHDLRHSLVAIAFELGLTAPEVAVLARHANAKVTLTVYAGLTGDGRDKAVAKLAEGGFGA
jgi:integrase